MNEKNTTKDSIVIFTAKKARDLLKKGHQIVDVKPDKTDEDRKRSVFVFKLDTTIMQDINEDKKDSEEA